MAWCVEQLEPDGFPYKLQNTKKNWLPATGTASILMPIVLPMHLVQNVPYFPFLGVIQDETLAGATFDYITDNNYDDRSRWYIFQTASRFSYHWWMTIPIHATMKGIRYGAGTVCLFA